MLPSSKGSQCFGGKLFISCTQASQKHSLGSLCDGALAFLSPQWDNLLLFWGRHVHIVPSLLPDTGSLKRKKKNPRHKDERTSSSRSPSVLPTQELEAGLCLFVVEWPFLPFLNQRTPATSVGGSSLGHRESPPHYVQGRQLAGLLLLLFSCSVMSDSLRPHGL